MFTLFAEDAGLLPRQTFAQLLEAAEQSPEDFRPMCERLFTLMRGGGLSVVGRIPHINGGVFSDPSVPNLTLSDVQTLRRTAARDWRASEPGIFGTLFERIIDPGKRGQLGAHYTPLPDILDVVQAVVLAPLRTEWEALRQDLAPVIEEGRRQREGQLRADLFSTPTPDGQAPLREAETRLTTFQTRLAQVTVLDPGMGSGNFLYVTLRLLLDLEAGVRATLRGVRELLGRLGQVPPVLVSPTQTRGLEVNGDAHEIASMVLW